MGLRDLMLLLMKGDNRFVAHRENVMSRLDNQCAS
jgi:hypothetical protein